MDLHVIILVLAGAALLEIFFVYMALPVDLQKIGIVASCIGTVFGSTALLLWRLNGCSIMLAVLTAYRVFNGARVLEGRMERQYLQHAVRRTTVVLMSFQIVVLGTWLAWQQGLAQHGDVILTSFGAAQALVATLLFASTIRTLRKTAPPHQLPPIADHDLPTVSICIPARNETEDLDQCLQAAVASDYPKLEILVLDDCSQTARTPEIIRSFAHAGVRFVSGTAPTGSWLAKNWAYEQLYRSAEGEVLLFCGVDVRLGVESVRRLIETMAYKHKNMLGIMPGRTDQGAWPIIQPMRYWWELAPPRRQLQRPPVLSSCWTVTKQALAQVGGFAGVRRAIVPEASLAREIARTDAYAFLRSASTLDVVSVKHFKEQRATAVRTRYPQLHRRPESVALFNVLASGFLLAPFVLAIGGWFWQSGSFVEVLSVICSVLLLASLEVTLQKTMRVSFIWRVLAFPFVGMTDLVLLNYSMYRYEFSTVEWKGRNVCLPVMHMVRNS